MKAFGILLLMGLSLPAKGAEIFENYTSVRGAGMGNAYTAAVDDRESLFYNPAGLDKIRGLHLTVLDLKLGTDASDVYTVYQNTVGDDYADQIRQFYGRQIWIGLSDSLSFTMRDFGFAAFNTANLSMSLNNPAYPNLNVNITNDFGFVTGFAASLLPKDILRFGLVGKRVTRFGARFPMGISTLATLSNDELRNMVNNFGTGYGLDGGLLLEFPTPSRPTFSFVWQDIGQTSFALTGGTRAPPPMDNNVIAGFGMTVDATVLKIRPAFEYRHINLVEEPIGKKLHLGVEFQFPVLSLRAGANQGYYTIGAGLDFDYLKIHAASYGVELQSYPGQREDRRYMVEVTIDLNFDPNFKFGGGGTRSSRLYQRR